MFNRNRVVLPTGTAGSVNRGEERRDRMIYEASSRDHAETFTINSMTLTKAAPCVPVETLKQTNDPVVKLEEGALFISSNSLLNISFTRFDRHDILIKTLN